ncbi:hypothetical protein SBDP1_250014 [Syntrophobacter sp. SbD1]|nr:hypothetical protein SBDP1_250014 [Syntrophobacter sp. SbD1]
MSHLSRSLRPVRHETAPWTVAKSGNYAFECGGPSFSRRTSEREEPKLFNHPGGKLTVAAPADYGEIALIAEKIENGRITKVPKGGYLRPFYIKRGPVEFLPYHLNPACPVKKSKGRGCKVRQ